MRSPESGTVVTEVGTVDLAREGGVWRAGGIEVIATVRDGRLRFELSAPEAAVKHVEACWTDDRPVNFSINGWNTPPLRT